MHISSITLERVCCQSGKLSFVRCVQEPIKQMCAVTFTLTQSLATILSKVHCDVGKQDNLCDIITCTCHNQTAVDFSLLF